MAVNFNQPYGVVGGDSGPAHYEQGGVYYRIDGVTVTDAPGKKDLTPTLIAHQQAHEELGVVTATTDPVTGGIDISAEGSTLKLPAGETDLTGGVGADKTSSAVIRLAGNRVDSSTAGGLSWQLDFCLPVKARAIRVAFPVACINSGGATIDAAFIAPTSNLSTAHIAPNGGAVAMTWSNGKTTPIAQAYVANIPENDGLIWTDWASVTSLDRTDVVGAPPAYVARVYSASTNTALLGNAVIEPDLNVSTYPLPFKTWAKAGNFVSSNTGGFTSPTQYGCSPIVAIEYIPESESGYVPSVCEFSDSLGQGYGLTDQGIGPVTIAYDLLKATQKISPYMSCLAGRMTLGSYRAYVAVADKLPPGSIIIFRPYSRNSGANTDSIGIASAFIETALKNRHTPVLQTGFYESANTANNATMVSVNAATRALATAMSVTLIDLEPVITAANAATHLQADGIHESTSGRLALAQVYVDALSPLF